MRRTRKIFRGQTLLRYGAFAGTFVAFVLFFRFDVLNIVGYVPQPQEVASITFENYIEGCELTVSDPEMIEEFCALHELIVDSRDSAIDPEYGYVREQVSITYTLKNGDSVERYYVFSKKQPVVFEQALEFFSSPAFNELFLDFLEERTLSISDSRLDNLSEEMDGIFEALRNDIQTPQALYLNPAKNDAVRLELSYRVGTMVSSMIIYLPNTAEHTYSYLEQIS